MTNSEEFKGDQKTENWSFLGKPERKFIDWAVPRLPSWIQSYHLTLLTIVWSGMIVIFGFLAQYDIRFFWGTSLMIFMQWLTDAFDGSLGKYRKMGLIKWGYYMDHFLDYIFLCALLIGYSFVLNDYFNSLFFILAVFGAFMVNSYLSFAVHNKLKVVYLRIGPPELRLIFIIIDTLLIIFGKTYLAPFLPYVLIFSLCGLCYVVYKEHRQIWEEDMRENKDLK